MEFGVGLFIGIFNVVKKPSPCLARFGSDFSKPNGSFYGFDLAEERANPLKFMGSPML